MENIQSIDIKVFSGLFGMLLLLLGAFWKTHEAKLVRFQDKNEKEHKAVTDKIDELTKLYVVTTEIRTDLKWIIKNLKCHNEK